MARARYKDAVKWIAVNDDTTFLDDDEPIPSVSVALVADLFGKDQDDVLRDLRKEVTKLQR